MRRKGDAQERRCRRKAWGGRREGREGSRPSRAGQGEDPRRARGEPSGDWPAGLGPPLTPGNLSPASTATGGAPEGAWSRVGRAEATLGRSQGFPEPPRALPAGALPGLALPSDRDRLRHLPVAASSHSHPRPLRAPWCFIVRVLLAAENQKT